MHSTVLWYPFLFALLSSKFSYNMLCCCNFQPKTHTHTQTYTCMPMPVVSCVLHVMRMRVHSLSIDHLIRISRHLLHAKTVKPVIMEMEGERGTLISSGLSASWRHVKGNIL